MKSQFLVVVVFASVSLVASFLHSTRGELSGKVQSKALSTISLAPDFAFAYENCFDNYMECVRNGGGKACERDLKDCRGGERN